MKTLIFLLALLPFSTFGKDIFLGASEIGEVFIRDRFATVLEFESEINTVGIGDLDNFLVEVKKRQGLVLIKMKNNILFSNNKRDKPIPLTNLKIVTSNSEFNLILTYKRELKDPFYKIYTKRADYFFQDQSKIKGISISKEGIVTIKVNGQALLDLIDADGKAVSATQVKNLITIKCNGVKTLMIPFSDNTYAVISYRRKD